MNFIDGTAGGGRRGDSPRPTARRGRRPSGAMCVDAEGVCSWLQFHQIAPTANHAAYAPRAERFAGRKDSTPLATSVKLPPRQAAYG